MSDDKHDPILAARAAALAIALQNPELEPPPTEPAPPLEQRPAFELVSATLWTVVVAFRPQPDVAPVHAELHLLTASADGSEVYPLAIARARELSPQALEITVTAVSRLVSMARICIRSGDRAFVGELFGGDHVTIFSLGHGTTRRHRARIRGTSLDTRPSWLPEQLVAKLVEAMRAAAQVAAPSGRISSCPPDPRERWTEPDWREMPTVPAPA